MRAATFLLVAVLASGASARQSEVRKMPGYTVLENGRCFLLRPKAKQQGFASIDGHGVAYDRVCGTIFWGVGGENGAEYLGTCFQDLKIQFYIGYSKQHVRRSFESQYA